MDDARPGGHPLGVAVSEASGGAQRIGVIDQSTPHIGDGLEPTVRVLGEPRDHRTVVHVPAILGGKVRTHLTPLERCVRAKVLGALGIGVVVVGDEQKRIERGPLGPQRKPLADRASHAGRDGWRGGCAGWAHVGSWKSSGVTSDTLRGTSKENHLGCGVFLSHRPRRSRSMISLRVSPASPAARFLRSLFPFTTRSVH